VAVEIDWDAPCPQCGRPVSERYCPHCQQLAIDWADQERAQLDEPD
jgi:endogenous inhibitor of DNA gyrase (YacG/DUF329 family)